jgi:tetratricopeptide (TPR) repeat protein
LTIARETGDKRGEAINLGRLGDTFRDQGQLDTAVQHHERGLNIARQMEDKRGEGYSLADLATDYLLQKQPAKAIEHFQQARIIFDGLAMKHRVAHIDECINEAQKEKIESP